MDSLTNTALSASAPGVVMLVTLCIPTLLVSCGEGRGVLDLEERGQWFARVAKKRSMEHMLGSPKKELDIQLRHPKYVGREQANDFLDDDSRVFFLRVEGLTVVYPELVITAHHVVNETFEGKPLAITYCLLTGSAMAYSRELDGQRLAFGALGTFYDGNVVFYDDATDSYWTQLTGEAFHGKFKGTVLPVHQPLESTTWGKVKDLPYVNVLGPQDTSRLYKNFYENEKNARFGLSAARKTNPAVDSRLDPYVHGLGIVVHDEARFYPRKALKEGEALNDVVGGWAIAVVHDRRFDSVKVFRRYVAGRRIVLSLAGDQLMDPVAGSRWDLDGKALPGTSAARDLERPVYTEVFWFAWSAFFPETQVSGSTDAK